MGLYKFSIAAAASPSDIEAKITSVRGQGANIYLHSIVDIGNLNLSINNKNVTINYDLIGTKQNSLFNWYICDTVGYETIIILYNSGTESDSTFGLANYNRIYFNVKNQLVSNPKISVTLAAQFNVLRGRFDSYESDGGDDDVIMLTKCVYNDGSNIETGEAVVADNLYVSTNLRSTSFKTIVKDENNKQFINVGGIFYLPYSEEIIYPSWSEKQWILPPGTVDYEWHPATMVIPEDCMWWDTENVDNWKPRGSIGSRMLERIKNTFCLKVPGYFTEGVSLDLLLLQKKIINIIETETPKVFYMIIRGIDYGDNRRYINIPANADNFFDGINITARSKNEILITNTPGASGISINKTLVSKDPCDFHVFAIKIYDLYLDNNYYSRWHSYNDVYIDSNCYLLNKDTWLARYGSGNSNQGYVGIENCEIKYFAQVNHDQSSKEIIKTSQLLMDKFDIH